MPSSSTTTETPLVQVKSLHIAFGRQKVLRDLTLSVPRDQTVAIVGESGCGKTVLMKAIIGLIRPTSGQILFDGQDIARLSDKELTVQRCRFGYVFQSAALFDSMTVGQNVAFPLRQHRRLPEPELQQLVLSRLEEVGLPRSVVVKKPAELSGGMRKRVGLARALILKPELILYDEPTTGLDPIMSDVINELILNTRRNHHVTGLVVTHDMHTARKVTERVIMLYPLSRLGPHDPQIVFDGPPEELDRSSDRRVRQFVRGEAGERLMELREQNEAAAERNA